MLENCRAKNSCAFTEAGLRSLAYAALQQTQQLLALWVAGFAVLTSNSTAQAIVQINAPVESRGRVIGLFNMVALGLRFGSGISVGIVGGLIGAHWSLFAACIAFMAFVFLIKNLDAPISN